MPPAATDTTTPRTLTLAQKQELRQRSLVQHDPQTGPFCVDCCDDLPESPYERGRHICGQPAPIVLLGNLIGAVRVTPRRYFYTYKGGTYAVARDWFGAEVILRSSAPGRDDAYAVCWKHQSTSSNTRFPPRWYQAAPSMSRAELQAWDGREVEPERGAGRASFSRELEAYLDVAVVCDPDLFRL